MPYWGDFVTTKLEPEETISPGDGVNTFLNPFAISRSECVSMKNMTNTYYPSISCRLGKAYMYNTSSAPLGNINGIGTRNNQYVHVFDGTTWAYYNPGTTSWVVVSTSNASNEKKFLEFNTQTTRYTVVASSSYLEYYNGTTNADITGAPQTKFYTVDDFRLFALSCSVISYCAAGDLTDWTTADDAGEEVLTGMVGVGTGIISFNDMVIAFGEHSMHILYGNTPYDFQLSDPIKVGCVSDKSIIEHNNVLYWFDYNRIMAFTGGYPVEVGQKVKMYIENIDYSSYKTLICAGKSGKYIYWSIPYGTTTVNNYTLQYDTELKSWFVWDVGFKHFFEMGEYLYGVTSTGIVWQLNNGTTDGGTAISWEWVSGVWNASPLRNKKVISDIYAIVDLPVSSTLTAYYSESVDSSTDWTSFYTFTASANEQNARMQIPVSALQGVNWYRLKLAGTGQCTIHYIEPYVRVKRR